MKENKYIQITMMLFNTITIGLWILLAMFFNTWWLALFSLLFLNYKKIN